MSRAQRMPRPMPRTPPGLKHREPRSAVSAKTGRGGRGKNCTPPTTTRPPAASRSAGSELPRSGRYAEPQGPPAGSIRHRVRRPSAGAGGAGVSAEVIGTSRARRYTVGCAAGRETTTRGTSPSSSARLVADLESRRLFRYLGRGGRAATGGPPANPSYEPATRWCTRSTRRRAIHSGRSPRGVRVAIALQALSESRDCDRAVIREA